MSEGFLSEEQQRTWNQENRERSELFHKEKKGEKVGKDVHCDNGEFFQPMDQ